MKTITFFSAVALLASATSAQASPGQALQRAEPRAPLIRLFTAADYPVVALAKGEQGRVGYRLAIAANGRVSDCAVTRSSGSSVLDVSTCRILRSRARFIPARDAAGEATTDSFEGVIPWILPPSPRTDG